MLDMGSFPKYELARRPSLVALLFRLEQQNSREEFRQIEADVVDARFADGRAAGNAEGDVRGKSEGKAEALMALLAGRFGTVGSPGRSKSARPSWSTSNAGSSAPSLHPTYPRSSTHRVEPR